MFPVETSESISIDVKIARWLGRRIRPLSEALTESRDELAIDRRSRFKVIEGNSTNKKRLIPALNPRKDSLKIVGAKS